MTVFEAKKIAEQEFAKIYGNGTVSTGYRYIVVSDKSMEAMFVPDYNTALQCGVKWVFKARMSQGQVIVELCEIH